MTLKFLVRTSPGGPVADSMLPVQGTWFDPWSGN